MKTISLLLLTGVGLCVGAPALAQESAFKDRHPKVYRSMAPVRATCRTLAWVSKKTGVTAVSKEVYYGCVVVGEKSKPIQPFFGLVGSVANTATPFIAGFTR